MQKHPASFRDPNGFVYWQDGTLLRQVNHAYAEHYDWFHANLYPLLAERSLIIPHTEVTLDRAYSDQAYKILQPQRVPFVSYPYEWSFAQLKDAALLTLRIQKIALKRGMTLKDASAYNVQFLNGKPIFVDTLSFEKYREGEPWVAYRQFCQHFLAPLAIAAYRDVSLLKLLMTHIDGIPLELASQLIPWKTQFNLGMRMHIHLHARAQSRHRAAAGTRPVAQLRLGKDALNNIVQSLEDTVQALKWSPDQTAWADYYDGDSYSAEGFAHKQALVRRYLQQIQPAMLWDLGANAGDFSQIAAENGVETISWDYDYGAVQIHYERIQQETRMHTLPLILDLTNPSPAIGWANAERDGLLARAEGVGAVMALALIHHLVIGNNVPMDRFAAFLKQIAPYAIVEFVPKADPKVQTLLASRLDIFDAYHEQGFEKAIEPFFEIISAEKIADSLRTLYLLKGKA
jgi:ribosomal protein L11 methylase PrmA